jgi:hypothetical protein
MEFQPARCETFSNGDAGNMFNKNGKTYRPFTDAREFAPHRNRWISNLNGATRRVDFYNDFGVNGISYESLLRNRQFEDGTPIGVEVTDDEFTL